MQALQPLLDTDNQDAFHQAWSSCFLDTSKVRQLQDVMGAESAMELLKAGASWNGSGWNTGRASKALHDLVGVPLVTSDFSEYRNAFF